MPDNIYLYQIMARTSVGCGGLEVEVDMALVIMQLLVVGVRKVGMDAPNTEISPRSKK